MPNTLLRKLHDYMAHWWIAFFVPHQDRGQCAPTFFIFFFISVMFSGAQPHSTLQHWFGSLVMQGARSKIIVPKFVQASSQAGAKQCSMTIVLCRRLKRACLWQGRAKKWLWQESGNCFVELAGKNSRKSYPSRANILSGRGKNQRLWQESGKYFVNTFVGQVGI